MAQRILVVEDESSILSYCKSMFENAGFIVDGAPTAAEGRKLFELKPDLVVLDIGLPDANGIDLLKEWRQRDRDQPPVIFLTAQNDLKLRLKAFETGAQDYATKPFSGDELLARVMVHLRVRQSNDQLKKKTDELELVSRARQDMTDMIVHDLKTPLMSIRGTLQLIRSHGLISEENYANLVEHAGSAADIMLLMLNDMLDVGRSQRSALKADLTTVEIAAIFAKLNGLFAGRARLLNQALVFSARPDVQKIKSDQNLLYRLLANLISNALKASGKGQTIETLCQLADGKVRFAVSDRGDGIPDADKMKIFERYVTTNRNRATLDTGSGIGLTFCRAAAEALGGKLWVEDRQGGGSTFFLEHPYLPG